MSWNKPPEPPPKDEGRGWSGIDPDVHGSPGWWTACCLWETLTCCWWPLIGCLAIIAVAYAFAG